MANGTLYQRAKIFNIVILSLAALALAGCGARLEPAATVWYDPHHGGLDVESDALIVRVDVSFADGVPADAGFSVPVRHVVDGQRLTAEPVDAVDSLTIWRVTQPASVRVELEGAAPEYCPVADVSAAWTNCEGAVLP
jgi:hypothetical protein